MPRGTLSRFSWSSSEGIPGVTAIASVRPLLPHGAQLHDQARTTTKVNAHVGPTYPIRYLASLYPLPIVCS